MSDPAIVSIIGIDPGSKGGLCHVHIETGKVLEILKMPTYQSKTKTGGNRTTLDVQAIVQKFSDWQSEYEVQGIWMEHLHAVGVFSCHVNFWWGSCMKAMEMYASCSQVPFHTVPATEWQKFHWPGNVGKHEKENSRMKVRQTHPYLCAQLNTKESTDMAEAVLIAEYGIKQWYKHAQR